MAAIGWGVLSVADRLGLDDVAARCGLAADDVLAVLPDLERDGLITTGAGTIKVAPSTTEGLRELLDLRVLIEVQLARCAAEKGIDEADGVGLLALAGNCQRAAFVGDDLEYVRTDLQFHLHLSGLAGKPEMVELVRVLRARSRIGGIEPQDHRRFMILNAAEHDELARAVIAGRPNVVDTVLRRHISRIRDEWFGQALEVEDPLQGMDPG